MDDSRPVVDMSALATVGSEDSASTLLQRAGAIAVCAMLVVVTFLAETFGSSHAPLSGAFVPITATIWSLADLLTAFLLLAQFYVGGSLFLGIIAGAYGLTGLLTWSYLAAFPGVVRTDGFSLADHQTGIYLWLFWHCAFPLLVLCAAFYDSTLGRIVARKRIQFGTALIVTLPIVVTCLVTATIFEYRDELPVLVVNGHFQQAYKFVAVPVASCLNVIACWVLLARRNRFSPLALCISVAFFSATLDAYLDSSTTWFTYAWATGKLITVFTSSIVLGMILCDVAGVYGRLARLAKIDVLTSLYNRRAFDEHYRLVFNNARRQREKMSLLLIDVDFFKKFNDTYGHLAGDECLRRVAQAMATCVTRPLDIIARYGGEEFVVVLPETSLAGVFIVAEHIRAAVEALDIVMGDQSLGRVTVSVGIGHITDAYSSDETVLLHAADRGLYDAKDRGRNRVILGTVETVEPERKAFLPAARAAVTVND